MFERLRAVPKNYDWGIPNAMSELLGEAPTGKPEAELWFGSHAMAQCSVEGPDGSSDFQDWLGATGHAFPLLVKFLAAAKPLSIQVHPNAKQAEAGYARENSEGIALDDPSRSFKDSSAKPELLISLSESFDALVGLLTDERRAQRLERFEATGLAARTVEGLSHLAGPTTLAKVLAGGERVASWADDLASWSAIEDAGGDTEVTLERQIFRRIAEAFPGDRGIVVAFLMHTIRLGRGEAVFVSPGQVHAYVGGFGLEVMLPSDNVVRGGLTSKHQDVALFLETAVAPAVSAVPIVSPVNREGHDVYESAEMPFAVSRITGACQLVPTAESLIVGEHGTLTVSALDAQQEIRRGEVYFVPAVSEPLVARGEGTVWLVEPVGD